VGSSLRYNECEMSFWITKVELKADQSLSSFVGNSVNKFITYPACQVINKVSHQTGFLDIYMRPVVCGSLTRGKVRVDIVLYWRAE
jgi:hypothetical protein